MNSFPFIKTRLTWLALGWLAALGLCRLGLQGMVAEWPVDLAICEFVVLLSAAIIWRFYGPTKASEGHDARTHAPLPLSRLDVALALAVAALSLAISLTTASSLAGLPPAYHDEYSYLFQAQSLLQGRWTWPSPTVMPELFDQFHVLNEGRMASRYYPGTGLWLAPWLWLGDIYLGQAVAGAIAASLVYGIGRELSGRITGLVAGLTFAVAPGPALFSTLLLAHHATLLGLMVFLWGFVRGARTHALADFLTSGTGLAFALLCRPATAAGFGLPFGIWCAVATWQAYIRSKSSTSQTTEGASARANDPSQRDHPFRQVRAFWIGYGVPLAMAIGVACAYNAAATSHWQTSPYQLYTDIYTPRHVYGLYNVERGERHIGPKVLDDYDRWAENLTPELANTNVRNRLIVSGLWTIGLPLLALTAVASIPLLWSGDARWRCVAWSIVTLHAIHWPYWYVGIMGWHYVFETAPLWCLLLGNTVAGVVADWKPHHRPAVIWISTLLLLAWSGMYLTVSEDWESRWERGLASIAFPRQQHAGFRAEVLKVVGTKPALVLIDQSHGNPHLDLVVNDAGLESPILYGRFRPDTMRLDEVIQAFPQRRVFIAQPDSGRIIPADDWLGSSSAR